MLITIVFVYCVARYCEVLAPENAKLIAIVALIATLLVAFGGVVWPAIPPGGMR